MFWGLCDYYWFIKVPAPVGWLGYSGALLTNREAAPDFTSALFCHRPANHCHSYLMCLTGTLESAAYVTSILPQVPVHGWLGTRAEGWGESLAWMLLVTMTAAAWLGWWQKAANKSVYSILQLQGSDWSLTSHDTSTVPVLSQTPQKTKKKLGGFKDFFQSKLEQKHLFIYYCIILD